MSGHEVRFRSQRKHAPGEDNDAGSQGVGVGIGLVGRPKGDDFARSSASKATHRRHWSGERERFRHTQAIDAVSGKCWKMLIVSLYRVKAFRRRAHLC